MTLAVSSAHCGFARRPAFGAKLISSACVLLALWPAQGEGEELLRLRSNPAVFRESFIEKTLGSQSPQQAATVGGVAGVQLGRASGPFAIDNVRIILPRIGGANSYCITIATDDGRYVATNEYVSQPNGDLVGKVETRSSYARGLSNSYDASHVVVRAVGASSCEGSASGLLVPAIPPGELERDVLSVYVNAPGDVAAVRLVDSAAKDIAKMRCDPVPDNAAITHTQVCTLVLTEPMIAAARRLVVRRLGVNKSIFYPILLQ